RTAAGVIDRTLCDVVEVTGRDRAAFLHAMLTNEIKKLAPGAGCAAAFLDVHGRVQFIVTVLVLEERILMLAPSGTGTKLIELFDRFLFSEKAYFKDVSDEGTILMVAGPRAPELIAKLAGVPMPTRPGEHVAGSM